MNIAIVDDRKEDSDRLVGFIDIYAEQYKLQSGTMDLFPSGEAFLDAFMPGKYDLVFLDIYMEELTGMETAKRIRKTDHDCRIVFITTTSEFAMESYDVNASFYLLKPIEKNGVFAALDRCGLQNAERVICVEVTTPYGNTTLPVREISYTEYVRRQILVHFKNGQEMEVSMSQRNFSSLLLRYPWFCDCIKGILVSFEDVDKLLEDRFLLKSGIQIPISRLKYRDVREQFLEYSYSKIRGGQHGGTSF